MTREQAIAKLKALLVHFHRLQNVRIKDLPPNARANARHQAMKRKWAVKKNRLLDLLLACRPWIRDLELRRAVQYELDHDEDLWQRSMAKERATRKARNRGRVA